jgi:hypothetical protein
MEFKKFKEKLIKVLNQSGGVFNFGCDELNNWEDYCIKYLDDEKVAYKFSKGTRKDNLEEIEEEKIVTFEELYNIFKNHKTIFGKTMLDSFNGYAARFL